MAQRISFGLVGCGIVSTRDILPNLVRPDIQERITVNAVCDIVAQRAQQTAATFGVPHAYADYRELIARSDIDVVAVATPIQYHFPVAMAAVEAGKHVYVQKTMTSTLDEANQLIDALRTQGVKLVASPGQHLNPWIRDALADIKGHLGDGTIGRVCWGRGAGGMRHEDEPARDAGGVQNVDPTWYYKPGAGPLRDVAVYDLHVLTWLLGPARRVTAMSGIAIRQRRWQDRIIEVDMDDNTAFVLDFGDATFISYHSHFIGGGQGPRLQLCGEKGSIYFGVKDAPYEIWLRGGEPGTWGYREQLAIRGEPPHVENENTGSHILADILHLVDCITEDREPTASAEHARHVIEIIDKVYESAQTGQTLDLSTDF